MCPVPKCNADLSDDETALLDRLFAYAPDLKVAYDFRNDLTAIFDFTTGHFFRAFSRHKSGISV